MNAFERRSRKCRAVESPHTDIVVVTYAPSPRTVRWVLNGDLPWRRIVRNDGTVAKPRQLSMLRDEGFEILQ